MKNKKEVLLIALVLIFSLIQTPAVLAEEPEGLLRDVNRFEKRENQIVEQKQQRQETNLSNGVKRVDAEINRRVNRLNDLSQRIQNDNKLSSDEKSSLSDDVQSDITGLTGLKTKVDSDTDITTLRSDAKEVVTSYRIYQVAVPKTRTLIVINNLQSTINTISGFTPKIQDLINALQSQGRDVSTLQSLLNDVNSRLTTISNQLSTDKSTVMGISASTTDPKSTFTQVRQDLASVRQNLAQVRKDFGQMRDDFRIIITGGNSGNGSASASPAPSTSPTPSATPTASPSPTPTATP